MTTYDSHSGNDQYTEEHELPTTTSAEPQTATSVPPGDVADRSATPDASAFAADDGRPREAVDSESVRPTPAEPEPSAEPSLFADDELAGLRARWDSVQAGFVDDPKDCVQKADGLVSDVVGQLTTGFTQARSRLEQQWGRGEEASTEDLRVALKRYRDFFERLLAV